MCQHVALQHPDDELTRTHDPVGTGLGGAQARVFGSQRVGRFNPSSATTVASCGMCRG